MSYILDALTRSQQQRERAAIPTLATAYLSGGSQRSTSHSWQGLAIGLASIGVVVALYSMSSRPPTPDAPGRERAAEATVPSMSPANSTQPPAVTERAAHLPSAVPGTARASLTLPRPEKDRVEHDASGTAGVRTREVAGQGKPIPDPWATNATPEITRGRADSPATLPERRLSPESRWLVDELLALRREAEGDAPRGQAPSQARQEKQDPAAPVPGRDVTRRPAHSDNPPPVGAPTGSASEPPTLRELPLETQAAIPALEINVHAYAQTRDERMVMINMKAYGEGDRLREGPQIAAITPTGVVLVFDNQRFQLPAR